MISSYNIYRRQVWVRRREAAASRPHRHPADPLPHRPILGSRRPLRPVWPSTTLLHRHLSSSNPMLPGNHSRNRRLEIIWILPPWICLRAVRPLPLRPPWQPPPEWPESADQEPVEVFKSNHISRRKTLKCNFGACEGMMRRAVFSEMQRRGLERRFQIQKYISKPERKKLAEKLGLKDSQVGPSLSFIYIKCAHHMMRVLLLRRANWKRKSAHWKKVVPRARSL